MGLLNLCNGAVLLIIFLFLADKVFSIELDCQSVESCPVAKNILSKRYIPAPPKLWSLLNIRICKFEDSTKTTKIWCPKFSNCKTPDKEFGTCMPAKSCADVSLFLNINMTAQLKVQLPYEAYSCGLSDDPEDYVCCPWPAQVSGNEKIHKIDFEEEDNTSRRKRNNYYPWLIYSNNGNYYFNDDHNPVYDYGFGSENFYYDPSSFVLPEENIYNTHAPANFFDKMKHNQKNTVSRLQTLLQKQNKVFHKALLNQSKKISEAHRNNKYHSLNWWRQFPRRNNLYKYNSTEKISTLNQEICMTPENFEGLCKEILLCPSFVKALGTVNTNDSIQIEYLKKFSCIGKENADTKKVCCSENPIVFPGTVSRTIDSSIDTEQSTDNPEDSLSNICGRQIISNRIIGGTTTDLAEFPWTALLYYTTSRGLTFGCGGIVISNRYLLTAAHCVDLNILREAGLQRLQSVVLGEYDRRNATDCTYTRYGSDCADPVQTFGIERILEHELFRPNATPNDIALVKLDRNIVFSDYIRPICLPEGPLNLKDKEMLTITGWGRTETGALSPIKRKARLPAIAKNNCNQLGELTDGQICLGSANGTDSCKGDSGGPVMRHTLSTSNEPLTMLVGIISLGFGRCGTTTSVSTYVPSYIDWILRNMT